MNILGDIIRKVFLLFSIIFLIVSQQQRTKIAIAGSSDNKEPIIELSQLATEEIYQKAHKFLSNELNLPVTPPPYMTMATEDEILVQHNSISAKVTHNLSGFYRPFNPEKIFILNNLSKNKMAGVMAHELTHAWASRNLPSLPDILEEGFARWVELKWYESQEEKNLMNQILTDPDPVYGDGLRLLRKLEQSGGKERIMKVLKSGKLPSGNSK